MVEKNDGLIASLYSDKNNLVKFLFSAVILSFGINLLANFFCIKLANHSTIILIIAISIIILVSLYIMVLFFTKSHKSIDITSVVIINKKTKELETIPRYEFSEKLVRNLKSVFLENEALKDYWYNEIHPKKYEKKDLPTKNENTGVGYFSIVKVNVPDETNFITINNAEKILNETIEYTILEKLSLTLSTFFNNFSEEDKYIKTYAREDISQYLLKNRVLNLLSTPFSDRPIFTKSGVKHDPEKGELVSLYGSDGSQYNKFTLILPKNSVIKRPEDGILEISNNSINLKITIRNKGFGTTLPHGFQENYLGFRDVDELVIRQIDVNLSYNVKLFSMFGNKKKNYHSWVDYFSNTLMDFCSFEKFVDFIHWEECLTNIVIYNKRQIMQKNKLSK
jgi:hypothetical protein